MPILNYQAVQDTDHFTKSTELIAIWTKSRCTITFNTDGGTPVDPLKVSENTTWDKVLAQINSTKPNKVLTYWSLPDGTRLSKTYVVTSSIEVTAHWADPINIDINGNIIDIGKGETWGDIKDKIPAPPNKPGYDFSHWSKDPSGQPHLSDSDVFDSNTNLYPVYIGKPVTITPDLNGGTGLGSVKGTVGMTWGEFKKLLKPDPTRTDWNFSHWSLQGSTSVIPDDYVLTLDTKIVAQWNKVIINNIVIHNPDGSTSTIPVEEGLTWGDIKDKIPNPSKDGYDFKGWSTDGNTPITDDTVIDANTELHPIFEGKIITIVPDLDGGTISGTITAQVGKTWGEVKPTIPNPTKQDFAFKEWLLAPSNTSIPNDYVITPDTKLVASWEAQPYFTISFDTNGGTPTTLPEKTVKNDGTVTYADIKDPIIIPYKADSQFIGWIAKRESECFITIVPGDGVTYTGETLLTITKGSTLNTIQSQLGTCSKPHYTFSHWSLSQNGAAISSSYTFNKDVTIYAVMRENQWTLTFNTNGGSAVDAIQVNETTTWATALTSIDSTIKKGNTFKCWSLTDGGSKIPDDTVFTRNIVIYAVWEPINIIITANTMGGTSVANVNTTWGTTWGTISSLLGGTPTKVGYKFSHWSLSQNDSTISDTYAFTSDTTVYAVWTVKKLTVQLLSNDGTTSSQRKQVDYDSTLAQLSYTTPVRDGYTFLGWNTSPSATTALTSYTFTTSINLYAVWLDTSITISFDTMGGTPSSLPAI